LKKCWALFGIILRISQNKGQAHNKKSLAVNKAFKILFGKSIIL